MSAAFPDTILAATSNPNKIKELQAVAAEFGIRLVAPAEVAAERSLPQIGEINETGRTYAENALIKARAYCAWASMPALGDDSGLEVPALSGRPGIYSARYLAPTANYRERMSALVAELAQLGTGADRRAVFRCALALVTPNGETFSSEGQLWGRILDEPQGAGGFGYDPIVLIDKLGKTLAEVDFAVTCREGFRPQAARKLFQQTEIAKP